MEDKVSLPRPKRARFSSDDVSGGDQVPQWNSSARVSSDDVGGGDHGQVPQWNSSIWDDLPWTAFDATGALQGDVLGRKEANNENGAAELSTFALDMTSDQFDYSLPFVPASTTVANSESPSAAKLGRITANAAISTATDSAGGGLPSPQTSFAGEENWQRWLNDPLDADGSMHEDAMLPADGSVDVAAML
ncbi:unnamed protein product [Zymoseptoria tritici ST99CH_1A5]|uniref:Uncharacterized protein n=2 Tax=Zymoseptoria tritici TaxID=1047171 RepID=A0A2H1H9H7_ZYMTR|nr:unnamed protein product [Zymoseptoria tritici ST99CH_1E4]SMR64969.1 unnamed protein product [Zymoseptoria tritici ST99CH_3D1]SMY30372.1 unnamed protein product [Zymoseptoria tritici ST99CH_1A5]